MFYVNAPTGQVSLHVLEKCVSARLEYLQLLYDKRTSEFNGNFEYLLESSLYDKIGHFTLRLLASTSSDLWDYWIAREILLFKSRLDHISSRQLYKLLQRTLRQLRKSDREEHLINRTIVDICTFFLKASIFKHIVSGSHTNDCTVFKSRVRYELVLDLIRTRELNLEAGYATLYCSQWKQALISLFYSYNSNEVKYTKFQAQHTVNQDSRLDCLYQKVHFRVFQRNIGNGRISSENINIEAKHFPLCMQNLHMKLRHTHRLSHYARWYYSLFLKDSGMQLEDAINYWRTEYSKPHTCSSTCAHSWQSNERKFVYSIRHLYGLEGSRKNYRSPDCELMCRNIAGPKYEGGCPYKNFDRDTLKNILRNSLHEEEATQLVDNVDAQKPNATCAEFFKMQSQRKSDNIVIHSPLQYYLTMIGDT